MGEYPTKNELDVHQTDTLPTSCPAESLIIKAGSACSPIALSPRPTKKTDSLRFRRQNVPGSSASPLPSVPGPLPFDKVPGFLPVRSSSLDSGEFPLLEHLRSPVLPTTPSMLIDSRSQGFILPPSPPGSTNSSHNSPRPDSESEVLNISLRPSFEIPRSNAALALSSELASQFSALTMQGGSDPSSTRQGTHPSDVRSQSQPHDHLRLQGRRDQSHRGLLQHGVAVITPPAELEKTEWIDSGESTEYSSTQETRTSPTISSSSYFEPHLLINERATTVATDLTSGSADNWLEAALACMVSCVDTSSPSGFKSVKVLSQALPAPSIPGHVFPKVIDSIHFMLPPSSMTWINVLHAVPGQFNLSDLPSRPTTPAAPIDGEDYFTCKVFDTAAQFLEYEGGVTTARPTANHLAPPGHINFASIERYIPPASLSETKDMFSAASPSMLVDRLVELSCDNSHLLFVYPTRAGGDTFMSQYLAPVLEPLLRKLMVINELKSDFVSSLASMGSIEGLQEYSALHKNIASLCQELSKPSSPILQRLQGLGGTFSVAHESRQMVSLSEKVWRDWWVRQEKSRIRKAVTQYFRNPRNIGDSDREDLDRNRASLVSSILDGVVHSQIGPEKNGIEIGVFVIRRCQ